MSRQSNRNNLLAGGFLVGAIVVAVVMSFVLSGIEMGKRSKYLVEFSLVTGAPGIQPGSPVKVGGQQVGKVREVRIANGPDGVPRNVEVEIEVRASIGLYEDAWVFLEKPLLGALSSINIPHVGVGDVPVPQGGNPRLAPGERLEGKIAPPAFLADAGFGPDQSKQLQQAIGNIYKITEDVRVAVERIAPAIPDAVDGASVAVTDVRTIAGDIRTNWPKWRDEFSFASERFATASDELAKASTGANEGVSETRELVARARDTLDDNRPRLDAIVANTDDLMRGLQDGTRPAINAAVDRWYAAGTRADDTLARAQTLMVQESPTIRGALANLRLMSDQLKLVALEVRQQPWRLLVRPDTRELEGQLLYDAARTYADAVSDLRAASESLSALASNAPDASPDASGAASRMVDTEAIGAMSEEVRAAFEKYRAAEAELLKRMAEQDDR
ncbi:MAG: hypothetical protein RBS39_05790 [Phycisphaerales bacterium]|nr:hypothetical protein [Phycisphaerales bacterium]